MDGSLSPLYIQRIINDDRYFAKCVTMAESLAVEKAEGVLYDRAINGYEEVTYTRDGKISQRRKKYCSKSLMEYLKANCNKYNAGKSVTLGEWDEAAESVISIDSFKE